MITVITGWRDTGCPYRQAAWDHVRGFWERLVTAHGWEWIIDDGDGGELSKARMQNRAIRRASGRIIVQADADSLVPAARILDAVARAPESGVIVPHTRYCYLDEETTEWWIAQRADWVKVPERLELEDVLGMEQVGVGSVGGITVFPREVWARVGGYDERFYHAQDAAFHMAAATLTGRPGVRLEGDFIHLYHPRDPQGEPGHRTYVNDWALLRKYVLADGRPDMMRRLVPKETR